MSVWQNWFDFKPDTIVINHPLEFSGTRFSICIMTKGHTNMRFGLIAYPKMTLIIAHSGVSRETRCLKVVWSLLQLAYFVDARSESPGEVMRTCRLVGDAFFSQWLKTTTGIYRYTAVKRFKGEKLHSVLPIFKWNCPRVCLC